MSTARTLLGFGLLLVGFAAGSLWSTMATAQRHPTDSGPRPVSARAGLTPEERFAKNQRDVPAASVVHRYGIRLMPELYAHLNPMPYEAAAQMETDLAEDLRDEGYGVWQR